MGPALPRTVNREHHGENSRHHRLGPVATLRGRPLHLFGWAVCGTQIDTAAIAHPSLGVPESHRARTVDFYDGVTVSNAGFDLVCTEDRMNAPFWPGLGVQVDAAAFGEPFLRAT